MPESDAAKIKAAVKYALDTAEMLLARPLPPPDDPLFRDYFREWNLLYVTMRRLEVREMATRDDGTFLPEVYVAGIQGITDELMEVISHEDPTGKIRFEIKLKWADAVADQVLADARERDREYA